MRRTGTIAAVALLLGGGMLLGPPSALPQGEGDPQAVTGSEHLAAIHLGTCREPAADPAFVLGIVGPQLADDGVVADETDVRGQLVAPPLLTGGGTVDVALDALLDGGQPYALLVHATADDLTDPLACVEIGGVVAGGQLALPLRPLGGSGYAGVAVLGDADTGGTAGTVLLVSELDAYESQADVRGERVGGGARVRQGGQQAGGGGGGGGGGRGGGGGGQSGIEVTGGIAPTGESGAAAGDRAPRVRRTRVADGSSATVVPPAGGEATGTATVDATVEATVDATGEATIEATVEAPIQATSPADAGSTTVPIVDSTATVTVGDPPPAVPDPAAPTTIPDAAAPTAIPNVAAPTAVPAEVPPTTVVVEPVPTVVPDPVEPPVDPAAETPAA